MKAVKWFGIFAFSLVIFPGCSRMDSTAPAKDQGAGTEAPAEPAAADGEREMTEDDGEEASDSAAEDDQPYRLVTDLSRSEVEAFAGEVRECVIRQDWTGLAGLVCDTVTVDGTAYSAEEWEQMDFSEVNADFIDAIREESCRDLFCNWQGIMMGNGEIWLSQAVDDHGEETLCIISINGMLPQGEE